jgi:hypothetical protein
MTKLPFILRFQEFCVESTASGWGEGTQTATNVRAEAGDTDKPSRKNEAFADEFLMRTKSAPLRTPGAIDEVPENPTTMSITAVHAEAVDEDRAASAAAAFPKLKREIMAGTETHTRIQAEQPDDDRGCKELGAFRSCSLS